MKTNAKTPKKWQPKALASAIACAYLTLVLVPAYASDTEIYVEATNQNNISPNLMMMFDTSGSMAFCMENDNSCAAPNRRIDVLKDAMNKILRGTPTVKPVPGYVKMGLGRFHPTNVDLGGYIAYPARPLDAFVQINPNGYIFAGGASGKSDAMQASSSDNSSTEVRIGLNGSQNYVGGFQFAKVRIPKGASITEAYLQVVAKNNDSGTSTWEIAAQAAGDAADYTSSAIQSRTYGAPFVYQPSNWSAGEVQQIPVTSLVQEVVMRSDWCGDNALAFRIRDIGTTPTTRRAYSYEGAGTNTDLRPQLVVKFTIDPNKTDSCIKNVPRTKIISLTDAKDDVEWWSDSSGSLDNNNTALSINKISTSGTKPKNVSGIYYRDLPIKQGSPITSAYLVGQSTGAYTNVQQVLIKGIKTLNLDPLCPAGCITPLVANNLPKTSASVLWTPDNATLTKNKDEYIDVQPLVQEIVNQVGWTEGQGMAFTIVSNTKSNQSGPNFRSRDGSATTHVRLALNWIDPLVTNLSVLETVRDQLEDAVFKLDATGGTPLGAAYAEASRYFYGLSPYNVGTGNYDDRVVTTTTPIKYISPIPPADECSANYVFLLSDGDPNNESSVKQNTQGVMNKTCSGSSTAANWDCMLKLATYNVDNKTNTATPQPKKRVRTNTVILGPLDGASVSNMQAVAAAGQGKFYKADTIDDLIKAISQTVDDAIELSGTITAAGVAVNQLNRLTHLDQLYYSVFEPRPKSYRWDGNLKRYKLGANASAILDVNNLDAIDSSTGFFKADAQSFWSTVKDGKSAVLGGAANVLPSPNDRKMYTYMGSLAAKNASLTTIDLSNSSFNTAAKAATGISDNNVYTNLMNWYKGYEIASLYDGLETPTTERKQLGAALHSEPVLVNYGYSGDLSQADNPDNQKNYVFFSTLEGTLHAIEAKTGKEKFSFIPGEKLATLKDRFDNPVSVNPEFGMDLTWTVFRKDGDSSGQITSSDQIYIYGGMRMGGSNYYALNVTNLDSPSLLFALQGGTGKFKSMGQTWSQPILGVVKVGGVKKTVIVFGGGYDPRHETANELFTGNDKGNQLYIVDAFTGEVLWFASGNTGDSPDTYVPDMKFSVPTSPEMIDMDGDGVADAIYFGDLGGQVFRVDLNSKATANAGLAKRVRLLAKVGQTESATTANQRRFYEPPAVAAFKDTSGNRFVTVAIGSGYRSRPLNVVTNERYFVLFDKDVTRPDILTANDSSLQAVITTPDMSELDMDSAAVKTNGVDVSNKKGWYVNFPQSGEKSMSPGLIFKSQLLFTTYSPTLSGASNCSPVTGQTNLYKFCMPYGKLCAGDSSYTTSNITLGLAGKPQLLITQDPTTGDYTVNPIVGTKIVQPLNAGPGTPYMESTKKWREKTINE